MVKVIKDPKAIPGNSLQSENITERQYIKTFTLYYFTLLDCFPLMPKPKPYKSCFMWSSQLF